MDENAEDTTRAPGATTIAPSVLVTIARLTALSIPGVVDMAPVPGGVNRLFRRGWGEGVRLEVEQESVSVDLHLVFRHDVNVREVSRNVQSEVTRAIEEMVVMDVDQINVHIVEIAFPDGEPQESA